MRGVAVPAVSSDASEGAAEAIHIENLHKKFGQLHVLKGVSFSAREGEVVWYGGQSGTVMLSDRKLAVQRPRLRKKGAGAGKEVEVPACRAMQDQPRLGARMLDILMRGLKGGPA